MIQRMAESSRTLNPTRRDTESGAESAESRRWATPNPLERMATPDLNQLAAEASRIKGRGAESVDSIEAKAIRLAAEQIASESAKPAGPGQVVRVYRWLFATGRPRRQRPARQQRQRAARPAPATAPQPKVKAKSGAPDKLLGVFYAVMAATALVGQVSGMQQWVVGHTAWAMPVTHWSIPSEVIALAPATGFELMGAVLLAFADWRRGLGESALAVRVLSVLVAAGVAAINYAGHDHAGQRVVFVGASTVAYLVYLLRSEARRRDKARDNDKTRHTAPQYGLVQWLRNPQVTGRARALAQADAGLSRSLSLQQAQQQLAAERKHRAIAKALRARLRSDVDKKTAAIALATYDLEGIGARIAAEVNESAMADLLSADLTPERLTDPTPSRPAASRSRVGRRNSWWRRLRPRVGSESERKPTRKSASAAKSTRKASGTESPAADGSGPESVDSPAREQTPESEPAGGDSLAAHREEDHDLALLIRDWVTDNPGKDGGLPGQQKIRDELKRLGHGVGTKRAGRIGRLAADLADQKSA